VTRKIWEKTAKEKKEKTARKFGDRKEILRDRLEEFERPFSIDVISGRYILRDRWRNLRDRFGPSKHLKKTLPLSIVNGTSVG